MLLEISVLVFTLAFLLFSFFSVLYLLQLRRTAKNIELVLTTLNQSLPGIMSSLDHMTRNASETVEILKASAEGLSHSLGKIQGMVDDVVDLEQSLRKEIEIPILQTLGTYNALVKGVRAFLSALISRP